MLLGMSHGLVFLFFSCVRLRNEREVYPRRGRIDGRSSETATARSTSAPLSRLAFSRAKLYIRLTTRYFDRRASPMTVRRSPAALETRDFLVNRCRALGRARRIFGKKRERERERGSVRIRSSPPFVDCGREIGRN